MTRGINDFTEEDECNIDFEEGCSAKRDLLIAAVKVHGAIRIYVSGAIFPVKHGEVNWKKLPIEDFGNLGDQYVLAAGDDHDELNDLVDGVYFGDKRGECFLTTDDWLSEEKGFKK